MDTPSEPAPARGQRKSRLKAQRIAPSQAPVPQPQSPYNPNTSYNPQSFQQGGQQPMPQQQFQPQQHSTPMYQPNQPSNQPAMFNPSLTNQPPAQQQQQQHPQQQQQQPQQQQQHQNQQQQQQYGQQILNDPMASMAVQYGQKLAGQGTDIVTQKLESYVSASNLKYYFAVDTNYVWRKIGIVLFPFAHTDWSIQYNNDEPIAPRYEVNSPDLYIPLMALVTFVLTTGIVLGTNNRFTPEQLGMQASTAVGWLIVEILALLFTLYLMNINTSLKYLDLIALCGYKYLGMILALLSGLVLGSLGYYLVLLWTSCSVAFFLVQTLRVKILPHTDGAVGVVTHGLKRRNYLLLTVAGLQPLLMWWLTARIFFG